jgi:hypothetical protein
MFKKTAIFMLFLLPLIFSSSKADVVYLTNDTMKVGGGNYANDSIQVNPGDARIPVTVYLRNTFDVAGFTLRLIYDSNIMYPYPPVPDSSFYQSTRSINLPIFGGTFSTLGEIYFIGSPFFNPNTEFIAEGRGPIVEFYFNVRCSAPQGYYPIKLEEDTLHQPEYDNTLGDTLGQHIYIPVLRNGIIYVAKEGVAVRGDANGDCKVGVSDMVYLINYLFKGGPVPVPLEVGDCNCDGKVTVGDVIYLINYLFKGGPAPCS